MVEAAAMEHDCENVHSSVEEKREEEERQNKPHRRRRRRQSVGQAAGCLALGRPRPSARSNGGGGVLMCLATAAELAHANLSTKSWSNGGIILILA